ncbi:hypothetical protein HXX76_014171 [Chlamydomonas incerta]|uniref:Uncharacterized protein n=1 Tax=Chlamydomonas incerta TaxID=51695 RepID=A0A835SK81_CHLIN|nr:hypothetical protein HXX76_014171 [Chlamydomonas incerta]|eukprot:KAG2425013.1 hypothetical protein HXX76_014171 [Chlamydomonas incerta]
MSPEEASRIARQAADRLQQLSTALKDADPDVAAEAQSLQRALTSFSADVALLRPEKLVSQSEAATDILARSIAAQRQLEGDDARALAGIVRAVSDLKRYVDGEGLAYFKRVRRASPHNRLAMVVTSLVLAVVTAVSLGVVVLVRRARERKARLKNRMLSSKLLKGQIAFEVLEPGLISGQRKLDEKLAAPLANNTYSFLISISEATVQPSKGVFSRTDKSASRLQVNARTAERLLELNFGGGVNCQFLLPDVPVYRWFTLHIAVADDMVRVYLDGDLRRTFYLHTCGVAVAPQSGEVLEFGSQKNVGVRYFKYTEGEMEAYAIKQEAYGLLREIQAQTTDAQKNACPI